jgi:predicted PurR-regulated permease PerM
VNAPRINRRLILFVIVSAILVLVAWKARGALWPFALGLALAFLIAPLVNRVHRSMPARLARHPVGRPLAIVVVYVAFVAFVAAALALIVPPLSRQASELLRHAPDLLRSGQERAVAWIAANHALIPPEFEAYIVRNLSGDLGTRLVGPAVGALRAAGAAMFGAVSGTVSWALGLVVVPIWLVYILKDTGRVRRGALDLVPHDIRPDAEALLVICDRVLSAYVRGQLVIAAILGTLFTTALVLLRVPYALLLGSFAGALAIVPFVGSFLGAIPAVAVALVGSLRLAALVVLAFLIIQQIDNAFISPRLQGRSVALNPALIMVVLVVGQQILGPIGLLVAVPLTAIIRDVVQFLYLRIGEDRPSATAALATVGYVAELGQTRSAGRTPSDAAG